jgi:hypothetical protein
MNTQSKTPGKRVVRVVSASAFRRLDSKVERSNKQAKTLRRKRPERDE